MNNTNPIDHAIVALLLTFEGLCWIINELAGFHTTTQPAPEATTEPELIDPREIYAIEATAPAITTEPATITTTFEGLNVKQLRILAREIGIQYTNKLRKNELIAALS